MSDGNRSAGKAAAWLLVVATAAVTAVQLAPAVFAVDELFVSNYSANRITVYARTANGDVAPVRTIRTGLDQPHTLAIDRLQRELFVANNLMDFELASIQVYDLDASSPDHDAPKRTITGPLTLLNRPAGIAVDSINRELYVANDVNPGSSILVFPLGASGNVAPSRVLQGLQTGIQGPMGMVVDPVHNELFVVSYKSLNGGSIGVFARTAEGNAPPLRTIQGPGTGIFRPQGLALDFAHDELILANSYFGTSAPGNVLVFGRSDSGDVAPLRTLAGASTNLCNPIGVIVDRVHDEIVAANSHFGDGACAQSVTAYARSANNDTAPARQIGPGSVSAISNPASVAVRTSVDCADPTVATGTACDDGNACTVTDTCQAGVCTGTNPVVCTALDQCHDVGVCDTATGVCTNPERTDGTPCSDNSLCTPNDACLAGVCVGSNAVSCLASDQCHLAGSCDPLTGSCSNPSKVDGSACTDGNSCTVADNCQAGACASGTAVVCTASDQCHDSGVCDTGSGICSNPVKSDGAACSDGNACSQTDSCLAGICTGDNPVVCLPLDACHVAGVCNGATGICSNPAQSDGTSCNDGNACTQLDSCQTGVCVGANPVVCVASDACHVAGVCDPQSGACGNPEKANGSPCDDGSACTVADTCQAGACASGTPIVCVASDQCHNAGICDTGTGVCSDPPKPDGTSCNDNDACTTTDTCQSGSCAGGNPVVCVPLNSCHDAGVCDSQTGRCSNPTVADGSPCSDGLVCTQSDSCHAGACVGVSTDGCPAGEIFASNYAGHTVTIFPRMTNGDAAPSRTIHTGLHSPHTLGLDRVHQELFVPNNNTPDENPAINIYDLTEGYPGYSDVPTRTIAGPAALLNRTAGLLVDSVHQELFVANDLNTNAAIMVFPLSANGNVAPIRILQGPQTTLVGPLGLALDLVHDELIIVSYKTADGGSITVFPRTASGDVAPTRTVQGPLTGFNRPQDVALDLNRDEMIVANSYFDSPVSLGSLLVFPRLASGNVAPIRQITGPSTDLCNPIGLVLDAVHDELVVSNSAASGAACGRSVATFAATASGDVAPLRKVGPGPLCTLNNSESVLVTTSVQCSDPSVAEGTPCDDGNACTAGAKCTGGVCAGGSPRNCDDGNPCSIDTCTSFAGCQHAIDLTDTDHDGACDLNDCASGDPTAFALPAETSGLTFASDKATLSWTSLVPSSGSGTVHDLVRGVLRNFPVVIGEPTETCLPTDASTPTATDASIPPQNSGYWYLVRGRNACGFGSYGFASGGNEELSAACPLALSTGGKRRPFHTSKIPG